MDADISIIVLAGGATQRDYQFHIELPIIYQQIAKDWGSERVTQASFNDLEDEINRRFAAIKPIIPVIAPSVTERVEA